MSRAPRIAAVLLSASLGSAADARCRPYPAQCGFPTENVACVLRCEDGINWLMNNVPGLTDGLVYFAPGVAWAWYSHLRRACESACEESAD